MDDHGRVRTQTQNTLGHPEDTEFVMSPHTVASFFRDHPRVTCSGKNQLLFVSLGEPHAHLASLYILLTSNLGLVGHTRQFQKPMSSRLIQHWHFLLRPMSSGHNHDIHRNMYEVFKETAPARTHSRTLCHHCVTRVPGSGI